MSKLTWDDTGSRIYETGIDHMILFVQDSSATETNGYRNGVAWNGITGVTESPSGAESNDIYADNIKYLSLLSAEDFGATIEAYTYPDEWGECDGSAEPVSGIRVYQQSRKGFALFYRTIVGNDVDGNDHGYMYHFIYNCKASPSERGYQTVNDSPEAISFSWEVTTTPITIDAAGYKPSARLTIDTTKFTTTEQQEKLASFLAIIEGSENADSKIMLPDQIIEYFSEPAPVTPSITLDKSSASVAVDATVALVATTVPAGTTVTWASSDGTVATVENGTVTGVSVGTATITASMTVDETPYTATCAITVTAESGEG